MSDTLRFVVDGETAVPKVKGALPLPGLNEIPRKIIEIGTDAVADGIAAALGKVYRIMGALPPEPQGHEVSEVRFNLVVDASGEISVLSALKGGITGHSGLEFTISRKR